MTGRLDAFQWQTPVASLPSSDRGATIDTSPFEEAMLAAPSPRKDMMANEGLADPPREIAPVTPAPTAQDNAPLVAKMEEKPQEKAEAAPAEKHPEPVITLSPPAAAASAAPPAESPASAPAAPAPMFRARADLNKPAAPLPVIPIIRAPDDPGIDDDAPSDEFVEQIGTPKAQAGGWRGFLSRWGG
jgi:HemY protein